MFRKSVVLVVFVAAVVGLTGRAPAQQPPAQQPAAPKYRYWKTNWSLEEVRIGELMDKLRLIGVELPIELDGRVSVDLDVSVPLNAPRTGKAYLVEGALLIRDVVADQLRFDSVRAKLSLRDGQLILDELRCIEKLDNSGARLADTGLLSGSAKAEVIPRGGFEATVKTESLRINPIVDLLSRFGLTDDQATPTGSISANVTVSGQVEQLRQPSRWDIRGDLIANDLRRGESIDLDLTVNGFRWKNRELTLAALRIESDDQTSFFVSGDASFQIEESIGFKLNLATNDLPLGELARWVSPDFRSIVAGKLDAKGSAAGVIAADKTIESMDLRLAIASPAVTLAGVDLGLLEHDLRLTREHLSLAPRGPVDAIASAPLVIESLDADYEVTDALAQFSNLQAKLFGGTVEGGGQFSRNRDRSHRLTLKWDGVDPTVWLPTMGTLRRRPELTFKTSGDLDWSVPAAELLEPYQHRVRVAIEMDPIAIDSQVIGKTSLAISLDQQVLDASLQGNLFGGTVRINTLAVIEQSTRWNDVPSKLQFREFVFEGWSMRNLLTSLGADRPRFNARLSGDLAPQISADAKLSAAAKVRLDGLTADGKLLARSLTASLQIEDRNVTLNSAGGIYAGGQLEIDGKWSLGSGAKLLTARLTRADGNRMLLPIHADAATWIDGKVSGRASIAGQGPGWGDSVRIGGTVSADNGKAFGLPVGQAHGPFYVLVSFRPLVWRATFPSIRSNLARGRVSGTLGFQSAGGGRAGVHVDSQWRINHVDFESLISESIGTSTIGRGNLTGDFRLGGRHVRGATDLDGQFRVRLGGTDATAVPGLSAAGSLLGATSLTGVRFEQGEAVGRVSKGRLILETVSMTSDRVSVRAQGTVGLIDRRLDVDAVISTGNFQGQNVLLRQLGTQALLEVVPIGQVNRILSDRTVVIQMVGPARDPVIRFLAGETLQANARRFATQELLGLIIADSLLTD